MTVDVHEYGFEPARASPSGRGRPSLLVLSAPPPAGLNAATRIILHDVILDGASVLRAAREAGVPVPLIPPVPARDARRLRDLLASRGVRTDVHPLGRFRRARIAFGSNRVEVGEGVERTLEVIARAGVAEEARASLGAVIRESVANAAHHGNRDDPHKLVRVDLTLVRSLLTLTVEDDGEGFDHSAVVLELEQAGGDAVQRTRDRAAAGRRGGLGLLMVRRWADALVWENGGRRIRVTKDLGGRQEEKEE